MTDDVTPQETEGSEETKESEAKRKFQEALRRKAGASRAQQAHQEGRQKIKGLNGPKGQNRTFRRKSG
ncbi:DUF5302 domain-containing protein [Streptomyces sp. CRN 30]|uniref:DUF5302 domain-containing protein n=1 Tax=Streptomyces sp. CRN 30 TaxID=3075613 RepID=UPI002A815037|nr:DUF5302 domain-containing protein [Streptomyces sp. CRN 30]